VEYRGLVSMSEMKAGGVCTRGIKLNNLVAILGGEDTPLLSSPTKKKGGQKTSKRGQRAALRDLRKAEEVTPMEPEED